MSWHIRTELDEIWDKLTDEQRQEVLEHARKVVAGDIPKPKMRPMDWLDEREHITIDTDGDHISTGLASTEWRHAADSRISSAIGIDRTSRIVALGEGTYTIESTDGELVNLSINDSSTSDF